MVGIGSAEFELVAKIEGLISGFRQAEQVSKAGSTKIAAGLGQIEAGGKSAGKAISQELTGGIARMAAAAVSFQAVVSGIGNVVQASREAITAQRALEVQYRAGAPAMIDFTNRLGAATAFSRTETQQAAAVFGGLSRNYGLTTGQVENLLRVTTDLAVVSGKDLVDASRRVEAAIRGETESSEQLGLSLQATALKGSGLLTAAEEKRLDVMSNTERAQVVLRVLLQQSTFAMGAAAKASDEGTDNFRNLDKAVSDLQTTLGESRVINDLAGTLATAAGNAEKLTVVLDLMAKQQQRLNELRKADAIAAEQQGRPIVPSGPQQIGDIRGFLLQATGFAQAEKSLEEYQVEIRKADFEAQKMAETTALLSSHVRDSAAALDLASGAQGGFAVQTEESRKAAEKFAEQVQIAAGKARDAFIDSVAAMKEAREAAAFDLGQQMTGGENEDQRRAAAKERGDAIVAEMEAAAEEQKRVQEETDRAFEESQRAQEAATREHVSGLQAIWGTLPDSVQDNIQILDDYSLAIGDMTPEAAAHIAGFVAEVNALAPELREGFLSEVPWERWAAGIEEEEKRAADALREFEREQKKIADEAAKALRANAEAVEAYFKSVGANAITNFVEWMKKGKFSVETASKEINELLGSIPRSVLEDIKVLDDFTLSLEGLAPEWQAALAPLVEFFNNLPEEIRKSMDLSLNAFERLTDGLAKGAAKVKTFSDPGLAGSIEPSRFSSIETLATAIDSTVAAINRSRQAGSPFPYSEREQNEMAARLRQLQEWHSAQVRQTQALAAAGGKYAAVQAQMQAMGMTTEEITIRIEAYRSRTEAASMTLSMFATGMQFAGVAARAMGLDMAALDQQLTVVSASMARISAESALMNVSANAALLPLQIKLSELQLANLPKRQAIGENIAAIEAKIAAETRKGGDGSLIYLKNLQRQKEELQQQLARLDAAEASLQAQISKQSLINNLESMRHKLLNASIEKEGAILDLIKAQVEEKEKLLELEEQLSGSSFPGVTNQRPAPGSMYEISPRPMAPRPRAAGGPVTAGRPYLVGERGIPELFVPSSSGWIAPPAPSRPSSTALLDPEMRGAGGGYTFDFRGAYILDPGHLQRQIVQTMDTAQRTGAYRQVGR